MQLCPIQSRAARKLTGAIAPSQNAATTPDRENGGGAGVPAILSNASQEEWFGDFAISLPHLRGLGIQLAKFMPCPAGVIAQRFGTSH